MERGFLIEDWEGSPLPPLPAAISAKGNTPIIGAGSALPGNVLRTPVPAKATLAEAVRRCRQRAYVQRQPIRTELYYGA